MQIHKNIKYSNRNQTLNVYSPLMRQAPIVLLIHGGGFVAFDNTRVEPIAQQLAEIGCVVVTPNYRKLGPNIYITDALDDILEAFFWTKVYGQTYGGNPNKMFVMGVSGGGVLAALVTNTRKQIASRWRLPTSVNLSISGTILCYTTVDMWKGKHIFPEIFKKFKIQPTPLLKHPNKQSFYQISPIWTLPKDQNFPPHLLMVGDKDPWVSVQSQKEYSRALASHHDNVELIIAKNKKHDFLNPKQIQSSTLEMDLIREFIIRKM